MKLKINTVQQIAQRYKEAIRELISQGQFENEADALDHLKIQSRHFQRNNWKPSKRNLTLIVKSYGISALWLQTNDPTLSMFQQKPGYVHQ